MLLHRLGSDTKTRIWGRGFYIVDVRTEEEFKNCKIRSSFNIDFQTSEFIDNLKKLDKEKPYIIYCMSGNRSSKASHVMKSLGFKIIYHYKKVYKDWIKD